MKTIISNRSEASSAVAKFKKCVESAAAGSRATEWAFPNGEKAKCETYTVPTVLGELLVAIPKKWNGRQAHLFALNYPGGTLAPDVEINIPDTLDRKVSGAYVKNGKEILICHRGGFTAYRGKIPKEVSHAYFGKWMCEVRDGDRDSSMIGVASLGSPSMADDIAEFVAAVSEMKTQFKAGESASAELPERTKAAWRDTREYEGKKKSSGVTDPRDYDYLHGPLCNALRRQLKRHVSGNKEVIVLSNQNVDVALVNAVSGKALAIFEVKTSASLSSQLYSAIGQLAYYKHRYGTSETATYLVLPKESINELKCEEFLTSIGIGVISGEKESFKSEGSGSLKELVSRCVRA
ncbi:MAG TPA: hypothetical protein PLN91_12870 [Rhodanobacteraceae bacterium]|nr:hypothetical protein [Rhodanobacteraceae bacterium]